MNIREMLESGMTVDEIYQEACEVEKEFQAEKAKNGEIEAIVSKIMQYLSDYYNVVADEKLSVDRISEIAKFFTDNQEEAKALLDGENCSIKISVKNTKDFDPFEEFLKKYKIRF